MSEEEETQPSKPKFERAPDCWKDTKWLSFIAKIKEKLNYTCQRCGNKFSSSTKLLRGHHQCYIYHRQVWEYPEEVVVPLCADCHDFIHKDGWLPPKFKTDQEAVNYVKANPIIKLDPVIEEMVEQANAAIDAGIKHLNNEDDICDSADCDSLIESMEDQTEDQEDMYGKSPAWKKKKYIKSSKKNIYKKSSFHCEKESLKVMSEIKKLTKINFSMFFRSALKLLAPIKKHVLEECRNEDDLDRVFRRYYQLVG